MNIAIFYKMDIHINNHYIDGHSNLCPGQGPWSV
jgi:hypothetical protein